MEHNPAVNLSPPTTLPEAARPVWMDTIEALADAGTLSPELRPMVERYSVAIARWRQAEAQLASGGVILTAPGSGVAAINAWHSISRAAAAEAGRLERELGLSPLRRARTGRATHPLLADGRRAPPTALDRLFSTEGLE